ncbi:MAG: M20 family metallopeptidase [Chloroflexota bacterium]
MTHPLAQTILDHLRDQQDEMLALLADLVTAESPSSVPETQAGPQAILTDQFSQLGYRVTHTPGATSGGYLLAESPGAETGDRQLLLGHSDTVWPVGTLEQMPLVIEDGIMRGPGVFDMKAGLVQGVFALRALRDLGLEPASAPVFLINSDEEIGSFESREAIEAQAKLAMRTLVLEPASGPTGRLKTARKGVGGFEIIVRGKAAHAGLEPEKGVSAILGMAQIIPALFALSDYDRGLAVNVGIIQGGMRSNVIAPECRAIVDIRIASMDDAAPIEAKVRAMMPTLPGTAIEIIGGIDRPPLEPTPANRALWHLAERLGTEFGWSLEDCAVGGGSDGNYTSIHTATLDGLGAVGDGAHALHEHIVIDKMIERSALLTRLLMEPA